MMYGICYIAVGLCLAYVLKHELNIICLISTKSDVKLRTKINEKKSQLELYLKLCPVWPFLLLKELYDEIKTRRQS